MERTENPRRSDEESGTQRGRRWDRVVAIVIGLSSTLGSVALSLAELVEPAALATASVVIGSGCLQRHRALGRLEDDWYAKIRPRIEHERNFSRLWVATGVALVVAILVLPPLIALALGAVTVLLLLLKGLVTAAATAQLEAKKNLARLSAAEECWVVKRIAEVAASVPFLRSAECVTRLAHYEVSPGQIGVLQFLALASIAIAFLVYATLGFAVGVSELAVKKDAGNSLGRAAPQPSDAELRTDSGTRNELHRESEEDQSPSYAESCPAVPDPQAIGHDLGGLFEKDGAPKAGCGGRAREVPSTGAWVSAGTCSGELRSVAVSAPGSVPVILYGTPARFAWDAAMNDELAGAEVAAPADGDVYLVALLSGTHGFARSSPSVTPGEEDVGWCWEATGVARPFAHLAPPLVLLWRDLIDQRASWAWPQGPGEPIEFIDLHSEETVADGGCEAGTSCYLEVGDDRWSSPGTAFVRMEELRPFMPAED